LQSAGLAFCKRTLSHCIFVTCLLRIRVAGENGPVGATVVNVSSAN